MTKLISGRHEKIPSANVSAERYQFLSIQEAEPDLGLPSALGQVFTSNLTGTRSWVTQSTNNVNEGSNLYYTNARVLANVSTMSINVLADVDITNVQLNQVLTWDGTKFIPQAVSTGATANLAQFAYIANIANSVVSLAGHTTTEIAEGANLYFTNARVIGALTNANLLGNLRIAGIFYSNGLIINGVEIISGNSVDANVVVKNLFANSIITSDIVANVITANSFVSTGVGVPTLSSATNINLSANGANGGAVVIQSSALRLKSYTYAEANALTSSSGDVVFSSNSKAALSFNGSVWEEVGSRLPLIFANVITANSIIINGTEIVSGSTGEANLVVTRITANIWNNLYTANVKETAGNLYFTNTRVVAALIAGSGITIEPNGRISANVTQASLNTSQVAEVASNLYYTNARVLAALSNANVEGNLRLTGTFYANSIVINGTEIVNGTTGEANLFVTRLVANTITANSIVINGTEIVNGASGEANVSVAKITANLGIISSLYANTALIGNLVLGTGVGGNITGVNRIGTQTLVANAIFSDSIVINGTEIVSGSTGESNLFVTRITANVWNNLYTANVIESASNLYFTNTRVVSALIAGNNVTIEPNGRISANVTLGSLGTITTDNVSEGAINKYFTNARAVIAITPLLTTSNVVEGTNLYYTNARARTAITGGTGVTVDWSTGAVSIGQDVSTTANVTFYNLSVTNNLTVYGGVEKFLANNLVVSDNMIYLNNGSINSNPDLGIAFNYNDGTYHHAGFFRDASDGIFKVFDNYSPEPDANIFINTDHASFRIANLQATTFFGNVVGTVSSLAGHTTTEIAEGANLYFTNARVVSALIAGQNIIIEANGRISANLTQTLANITAVIDNLTTDGISEGSVNLYYTNSRVVSAVTPLLTAANIANFVSTVNATVQPFLTTANVRESSSNLYFTYERVNATIQPFLTTANVRESSSNLYFTYERVNATIQPFLTTSNVKETTNLYFTNARVVSALIPGTGVTIEANGRISASISGTLNTSQVPEAESNLYFTPARVVSSLSAGDGVTITASGIISATAARSEYNAGIDGSLSLFVGSSLSPVLTFGANVGTTSSRYLLRSIHITNISNDRTYLTSNIVFAAGTSALIANVIPIPTSGSVEFLVKPMVFQANDSICLQGFDNTKTPGANLLSAIITYESLGSLNPGYGGVGTTLQSNTAILLVDAVTSPAVFETIRFVNTSDASIAAKCYYADANGIPIAYLSYNLPIPAHTSVELIKTPKKLNLTERLYVSHTGASNNLSVFASYKYGKSTSIETQTHVTSATIPAAFSFRTNEDEGTTLYYTIE
jgi:hypothetical protein